MRFLVRFTGIVVVLFACCNPASAEPPSATEIKCVTIVDYDAFQEQWAKNAMQQTVEQFAGLVTDVGASAQVPVQMESLTQRDLTRRGILDTLTNLEVGKSTTLIVYYHGHGATDGVRGHYFDLMQGDPVFRSEILDACLQRRNRPMLLILFSDCCSNRKDVTAPAAAPFSPDRDRIIRNLFLQHRGVVDVTGATYFPEQHEGQSGLIVPAGALFTSAACELFSQLPLNQLDENSDGFVSWREFFPRIQRRTDEKYQDIARNEKQKHQTPQAFCLARPSDAGQSRLRYRIGVDVNDDAGFLKIVGVQPNTPATSIIELNGRGAPGARFVAGDTISRVNGQQVRTIAELYAVLDGLPPKGSLRIQGLDAGNSSSPYSAVIRMRE